MYWFTIMINRLCSVIISVHRVPIRALFWVAALYLGGAIGFGTGYTTQVPSVGRVDPVAAFEKVKAGLSWPLYVALAITNS